MRWSRIVRGVVTAGVVLGLAMVVGVPAGQAGAPVQGGTLRAALTASAPTLDPHSTTHLAVREIGLHVFEGLLAFDAKFQVAPQFLLAHEIR